MNKKEGVAGKRRSLLSKGFRTALGWALIIPGGVLFLTPIPVGIVMVTAGFLLLHSVSPRCRERAFNLASRFPWAVRKLKLESFLNGAVPDHEADHLKNED